MLDLQLHDSGFQVRRKVAPDFACLEHLEPADWDDMSLYLVRLHDSPGLVASLITSPNTGKHPFASKCHVVALPVPVDAPLNSDSAVDPAATVRSF